MSKSHENGPISTPVVRTSAGLRDALFDALDGLRSGATSAATANAVAKLADQVVQTVHMELAVQKHASTAKATANMAPQLPAPVSLGQQAAA